MRLLAISDLHLAHRENREALLALPRFGDDAWLVLAGDTGERPEHLTLALDVLGERVGRVIWVPGNHDLWTHRHGTERTRGQDRYEELLAICRRHGALTPEDEYLEWPDAPGTFIVPMFLLFDYSFRPPDVPFDEARRWARDAGTRSADEHWLDPSPWSSVAEWCAARCDWTEARLDALPPHARTVLVNHWPLRYDLARPPRIPRFSLWSGTARTEDWARRYRARVTVSGHLHLRTTLWRDGARFEEVSLGYPRDWRQERGLAWYVREILPGAPPDLRFVPYRDPFLEGRALAESRTSTPRSPVPEAED
ncbi:MAG: metallophosphoesterase [Acidobacteria bacterium]|nr:metallophosphoesterase [Acidobacteriota bacterium]